MARPRVDFGSIMDTVRQRGACRTAGRSPHPAWRLLTPPTLPLFRHGLASQVRPIVEAVRTRGDAALGEYTARFDGAQVACPVLSVKVRGPPPPVLLAEACTARVFLTPTL